MIFNLQVVFFLAQILLIYFATRFTTNEIFAFLRIFIKEDKIVFVIISIVFLPGTIIHEMSHYLTATISLLNVREVNIFPQFEGNYIKLGSVVYEKKDILRGILVGIAPLFFGLFIFWLIHSFKIFPQSNLGLNILFTYLIFTISSTMFSSAQDLKDLVFILPLIIIIAAFIYVFNINIADFLKNGFFNNLTIFAKTVNFYLLLSLIIDLSLYTVLRSIRYLLKR